MAVIKVRLSSGLQLAGVESKSSGLLEMLMGVSTISTKLFVQLSC